jgi:hypothetical protein
VQLLLLLLLLQALVQGLHECLDWRNAVDASTASKLCNLQANDMRTSCTVITVVMHALHGTEVAGQCLGTCHTMMHQGCSRLPAGRQ